MKISDLKKQAEEMVKNGTMPSLEDVLNAVHKSRKQYASQIKAARAQGNADDKAMGELGKK